jgi:hypothetical protein
MSTSRPRRIRAGKLVSISLLACLIVSCIGMTAGAYASRSTGTVRPEAVAHASSAVPRSLSTAAALSTKADHKLVSAAHTLKSCLSSHSAQPRSCRAAQTALQRAGSSLAAAERSLARVAHETASASRVRARIAVRRATSLKAHGETLTWRRVANIRTYVVDRKVPGQAEQFLLVRGTSTTPPPVPGVAVHYSVRSAVSGSSWSDEQAISYAPAGESTAPAPTAGEADNPQAAPAITISGQTLKWSPVATVATYVLQTKVPGQAATYSVVSGTTVTPAAVPGATVRYSVRTAVDGSAWSPEVTISYAAATTPVSAPTGQGGATFEPGLNSGTNMSYDVPGAVKLGAKIVRIDFLIGETAAQIEPVIAAYAEQGIRVLPLATFYGSMPTPAEAQNLAGWAAAYGPGGTYWAAHGNGQLAIKSIEFGNETSYGYQYGDGAGDRSYQERGETYARRLKEAAEAIASTGINVGLLAQADDWTGDWVNAMYAAVPNLSQYVAGWTIHTYGPGWRGKIADLIAQTAAHGAPASIPIDITEFGLSTDNGRCLNENYGWNPCMNYQEAAETLTNTVNEMRQALNGRLELFMVYQVRDQANTGGTNNREAYFGALQHELQPKGPFTAAVQALLAV